VNFRIIITNYLNIKLLLRQCKSHKLEAIDILAFRKDQLKISGLRITAIDFDVVGMKLGSTVFTFIKSEINSFQLLIVNFSLYFVIMRFLNFSQLIDMNKNRLSLSFTCFLRVIEANPRNKFSDLIDEMSSASI